MPSFARGPPGGDRRQAILVRAKDGKAEISWRARGTAEPRTLLAHRIISCTSPQGDLLRSDDRLVQRLVQRGVIRPDAARLGIDIDQQGRTIGADGTSNPDLFAVGPITRGAVWEIVAVPDIRAQTWWLARHLSNAHWVGGGL